jgi:integrase
MWRHAYAPSFGNPNHKKKVHAYSLEEVAKILDALEGVEPARTVIAVAIFTGLRKGEINGLKWGDLKDNVINVNRTVWMSKVQDFAKTEASKAGVPVLPVLAEILEQHRNGFEDDRFMFEGRETTSGTWFSQPCEPRNQTNVKKAKVEWHGLHSFRRGIATHLHHLGMPDKEIQAVLRHSNIKTTQDICIQPVTPDVQRGLAKLGKAFKKMSRKK